MPTIICSYCEYVGQGELYVDRIADVEEHEENCPERPTGDADLCGRLAKGDPDSI